VGGISLGGLLVIIGVVLMFVWSFWIGLIIAIIGLAAFGGFARGRWYSDLAADAGRGSRVAPASAGRLAPWPSSRRR
jgi:hypothetical protein